MRQFSTVVSAVALGFLAAGAFGQESRTIADMERKPKHVAQSVVGRPKVSLNTVTVAQGKRSLRFECDVKAGEPATLTLRAKGAKGFNALAFDLYAEHANEGTMTVSLNQGTSARQGAFTGAVNLGSYIDEFVTVRMVRDVNLTFGPKVGPKPDWAAVRSVSFTVVCKKAGKLVYYLDHVRFEKASGVADNRLLNSSFEVATNPDTPDHWGRDLNIPPFGEKVWSADSTTAHHGKQSLRIGLKGKFARTRAGFASGKEYTFSVHMKADHEGAKATLRIVGVKRRTGKKSVTVGRERKRYAVTATTRTTRGWVYVYLDSDAVLWIDAAQLERGTAPRPYAPSPMDAPKTAAAGPEGPAPRHPSASDVSLTMPRAAKPPVIDGRFNDACWKTAGVMSGFVKLVKKEQPAEQQTTARICYDDKAIYLAVRAEQSKMKAVSAYLKRPDSQAWVTDLVEIFFDLNHDRRTGYQFAVNANGQKWQKRHAERAASWHYEWDAAGSTDARGWTVEVAIPYTCFDLRALPQLGDTIGLNVCRTSNPDSISRKTREYSSWAFSPGGFWAPTAFGEANGLKPELRPYRFEAADLDWDRDVARATIKNLTGKKQRIQATFCARRADGPLLTATAQGRVASGKAIDLSAPLKFGDPGIYTMFVRVADQAGRERLVSQTANIRKAGSKTFELVGTEFDFYTQAPEARARCFVEADPTRCKDLRIVWNLERRDEWWVEKRRTKTGVRGAAPAKPGINTWSIPLAKLPDGAYLLKAQMQEKGKPIAEGSRPFRKLPPARRQTRVNQWGRFLEVDGKPFFWYGFYTSTIAKPNQQTIDTLKDMKSVHATAVLNYCSYSYEGYQSLGFALDQAHKLGMKMWVHLHRQLCWCSPKHRRRPHCCQNEAQAIRELAEVIIKYRNHPAVLGWCSLDEPGNRATLFTREYTETWYKRIKALDPYRPCIFSHVTRPGEWKVYGQAMDLALMPFMEGSRYEKLFQEFWDLGMPIATNAPCYDAGVRVHAPTPAQQRKRMYKALIFGARGLCTYTYRPTTVHTWREFERVGREIETLAPVLLTPDDRLRVEVAPRGKGVFALLKAYKGAHYLIAVNETEDPIEAKFRLVDVPSVGAVKPMFDSPAARVETKAKKLTVSMKAENTAVYRIGKGK